MTTTTRTPTLLNPGHPLECTALVSRLVSQNQDAIDPTYLAEVWIANTPDVYEDVRRIARGEVEQVEDDYVSAPNRTTVRGRANYLKDWMFDEIMGDDIQEWEKSMKRPLFVNDLVQNALARIDYQKLIYSFGED